MKILSVAALLSVITMVLVGCGSTPAPAPNPGGRLGVIIARGELQVCSTGDYRPFTYYEPGTSTWSGIDVEMADDLARRLGVRRAMVRTSWKNLVHDFTATCDIAAGGVSITPERAKAAFVSEPYLDDGKTPLVRCDDEARFQTVAQINRPEVRVIVNPGGTNEQFVRSNLAAASVQLHQDNNTIPQEIAAGRADLMITDSTEAVWQARQDARLCAVHPLQPFTHSQKAYLLPLGDTVFQHYVNQWLDLARHDGTYERITKPWLG